MFLWNSDPKWTQICPGSFLILPQQTTWLNKTVFVSGRLVCSLCNFGSEMATSAPHATLPHFEFSMLPNQSQYDYTRLCVVPDRFTYVFFWKPALKWTPCPPQFVYSTTTDDLVKQDYGICFLVGLHVFLCIVDPPTTNIEFFMFRGS